jgi:hypothetical protein
VWSRRASSNNGESVAKSCLMDTLCLQSRRISLMPSMDRRISRLESQSRRAVAGAALLGLLVGVLLGAGQSPTAKRLVGTGLTIVDGEGHPIIDLAPDSNGAGRIHVRDGKGTAEVVLSVGSRGGGLDLFNASGLRLAKLGASPTGDGMLLLTDAGGSSLARLGRWEQEGGGRLWTAPVSDSSTP